ncbi:MAG TPA: MIP/aquaporin family protein [Gemmatimonadota bacterium]|nr:MIP/aquaporin family protein [Gemmatimonadota bacterium]
MIRYLTEFVGTFFLVLTVGLVILLEAPLGAVAIGTVLMVMVYMGAHVSGAHYNPAVSLAAGFLGKLEKRELLPYWLSQLAGAIAAALAVRAILGRTFAPAPGPDASATAALLVEVLFTFALCLVVLNAATHPRTKGNPYYGLAIGSTVLAGAIAGGPISGGAFNPAVGVGPILVHAAAGDGGYSDLLLYIVAPLVGGFLAAVFFRYQERAESPSRD